MAIERELARAEEVYGSHGDEGTTTSAQREEELEKMGLRCHALAAQCLRIGNRTVSAGDSYEAVSSLIASAVQPGGDKLTLIPDSSSALPLALKIATGVFQLPGHAAGGEHPVFFIGPRFEVTGTTSYFAFKQGADAGELLPLLQATQKAAAEKGKQSDSAGKDASEDKDGADDADESTEPSPPPPSSLLPSLSELKSRGYFGKLQATYTRRLAALPSCVIDLLPGSNAPKKNVPAAPSAGDSAHTELKVSLLSVAQDLARKQAETSAEPSMVDIARAVEPLLQAKPSVADSSQATAAIAKTEDELEEEEISRKIELLLPPLAVRLFDAGGDAASSGFVEVAKIE